MLTSPTLTKITPALLKAQRELKDAPKTATNPHFKSKYVPLDAVVSVCKEALNINGIVFIQGAEPGNGDTLSLTTRLLHESGEWIESTLSMRPVKADPQGIGSCITYARRYALASICGMASDEDDDGNAASAPEPRMKTTATPAGGHEHDTRRAEYGRIAVQKSRPPVKGFTEAQWEALLCSAFAVPAKEIISELSPIDLRTGIETLIKLIDEMETK